MNSDTFYRAYWLRQHRIVAQFLAMQAWIRGLDCIALDRAELESFLGLERFKAKHVDWLQDDLRPWFPYQEKFFKTTNVSSLHSIFLSRVPIEAHLNLANMRTDERIKAMSVDAPRTGSLMDKKWLRKLPSEAEMLSQLAHLSFGVITPDDLRPQKRSKKQKVLPTLPFTDPLSLRYEG